MFYLLNVTNNTFCVYIDKNWNIGYIDFVFISPDLVELLDEKYWITCISDLDVVCMEREFKK